MSERERLDLFLEELAELSKRYGLWIEPCGYTGIENCSEINYYEKGNSRYATVADGFCADETNDGYQAKKRKGVPDDIRFAVDENSMRANDRGFRVASFKDLYGEECSLQESSSATIEAIWFGIDDVKVQFFPADYTGWHDVEMPVPDKEKNQSLLKSGRMHLTKTAVRCLLPALIHFARTGQLPDKSIEVVQYTDEELKEHEWDWNQGDIEDSFDDEDDEEINEDD